MRKYRLNFTFMFVELVYGFISNSLGLISDSVHMFFDCSALVLTLLASYFAALPPTQHFPLGFARVEVVSGFVNCILLVFVACSIVLESCERLVNPRQIIGDKLIAVSVLGLLINVTGIFLLMGIDEINMGQETCKEASTHKKVDDAETREERKSRNENLTGLLLHITSDALGSGGVIISAVCVERYKSVIADPICSLAISTLIIGSIVSLLKSTVSTLTLRLSEDASRKRKEIERKIMGIAGVSSCKELKVWTLRQDELIASAKIICKPNYNTRTIKESIKKMMEEYLIKKHTLETY